MLVMNVETSPVTILVAIGIALNVRGINEKIDSGSND
jgi:hypothetical protein